MAFPSKDGTTNAAITEEKADSAPLPTNGISAPSEEPDEAVIEPNDPQLEDSLGLATSQDVDEGNCCMLTALDHTTTVDAASIEVAAANQPVRKSAIIAFPESVEVVFCHRVKSWHQHCSPC